MSDDNQQVIVRLIAVLRFVHPVVTCVASKQDDLQYPPIFLPWLCRTRSRLGKLTHQQLLYPLQFALLDRRQMINIGSHRGILARGQAFGNRKRPVEAHNVQNTPRWNVSLVGRSGTSPIGPKFARTCHSFIRFFQRMAARSKRLVSQIVIPRSRTSYNEDRWVHLAYHSPDKSAGPR